MAGARTRTVSINAQAQRDTVKRTIQEEEEERFKENDTGGGGGER